MRSLAVAVAATLVFLAACDPPEPEVPPTAELPVITGISPVEALTAPGTTFTITGENFVARTHVWLGSTELNEIRVVSPTTITAMNPAPLQAGKLVIRLEGPTGSAELAGAFRAREWVRISTESVDDAGAVIAMLRHPVSGKLFVSLPSNGGVFRSDDDGAHWARLTSAPASSQVYGILPAGDGSAGVLFTSWGAIHRSDDHGATWVQATLPAGIGLSGAAYLAAAPGKLFAVNELSLLRSTDGGRSFTAAGTLPAGGFAFEIAPDHGERMFIGTPEGVFWSSDEGVTWTASVGISGYMTLLAAEPGYPEVWASTQEQTFVSDDGGKSFVPLALARVASDVRLWPGTPARWAVATFNGIFTREVGSSSWMTLSGYPDGAYRLEIDGQGDLLGAGWFKGVRRYPRAGGPPVELNLGLGSPPIRDLFADGVDGRLYVATDSGKVFSVSPDDLTWRLEARHPELPFGLGVGHHATGTSVYLALNPTTYLDLGLSGEPLWQTAPVNSNAFMVSSGGDTVYAADREGIRRRGPDGLWSSVSGPPSEGTIGITHVEELAGDLYVLSRMNTGLGQLFRLKQGQIQWEPIGPAIELDSFNGNPTFAVMDGAYLLWTFQTLRRYTPGSGAWTVTNTDATFVQSLVVDPANRKIAYTTDNSLRMTVDSGATWTLVRTGLEEITGAGRLAIDPQRPDRLFHAAHGQLYYSAN